MILITGANGQLGTELRYLLDERNEEYVAVDGAEMDIINAEMVEKVFEEVKPTLVYHCAAYTAVDVAEDELDKVELANLQLHELSARGLLFAALEKALEDGEITSKEEDKIRQALSKHLAATQHSVELAISLYKPR